MRKWMIVVLLAFLAGWDAQAQPQPGPGTGGGPAGPGGMRRGRGPWGEWRGWGGPGGWRDSGEIDKEEWARIGAFMNEHSPRRWQVFQAMPAEQQENVKRLMAARVRMLQRMQGTPEEQEIYNMRLKRMEIEDEIFGLTYDLRRGLGKRIPDLSQRLEQKVTELVDLGLDERQVRINQWQKQLEQARQQRGEEIKARLAAAQRESASLGDDVPDARQAPSTQPAP